MLIFKRFPSATVYLLLLVVLGMACSKAEDPFVGGVASPVLIQIEGSPLGNFSTEPVVTMTTAMPLTIAATVYELDKTHILDYKIGIDSIPIANLPMTLSTRTGTQVASIATNTLGKASIVKTLTDLGLAPPAKDQTLAVKLQWTGSYKGQSFVRYFQLTIKGV